MVLPGMRFPGMITAPRMKTLLRAGVGTGRICPGGRGSRVGGGGACVSSGARARWVRGAAFARGVRRRTRPDAKFDAVAVAEAVLPDPLVIDAAPPLDRIVGIAPANVASIRLPHAAHDHPGAGE